MKTLSIILAICLSLLLLLNFCFAAQEDVAEFQPDYGIGAGKNGEEAEDEKFKFLHHHKPLFKKKPFLKPIPKPFVKKPIPHHPFLKKPDFKPHFPPVFPSHP